MTSVVVGFAITLATLGLYALSIVVRGRRTWR
jgi:hypothetical protein